MARGARLGDSGKRCFFLDALWGPNDSGSRALRRRLSRDLGGGGGKARPHVLRRRLRRPAEGGARADAFGRRLPEHPGRPRPRAPARHALGDGAAPAGDLRGRRAGRREQQEEEGGLRSARGRVGWGRFAPSSTLEANALLRY